MKNLTLTLLLALASLPSNAQDTEIAPEKREALVKLMFVTGATQIVDQFSDLFIQQMTQTLQSTRPDIPLRAYTILEEEVQEVVAEEIEGGTIETLFMPIYAKYFTLEEVRGLLAFYESDIGRKSIEVLPMLTQESVQVGQNWGTSLGPKIGQRVTRRLAEEGIELE